MRLVSGSQCRHQDSSPLTIKSKNSSPSFPYCSRCSKQTPTQVAFCFSFKLFSTHKAENLPIRQNLRDNVMHLLHAETLNHYMTITQHHLIPFYIVVWVSNVGWTTRASQVLSAAPTLFEPCAPVKHCYIPYPTAFPYWNGMVLHFYQQQESSTTKTVHKVINKGLKTYVQSLHTGENFH